MKALLIALLISFSISYKAGNAIEYARKHCNSYNPKYKTYAGKDCANFVSQCLIAGGLNLSGCGGRDEKGAIPLVSNLRNCLSSKGWKNTQGISNKFKAGFPFFDGNHHAMISTSVNGNSIKYCGHTNDRCDQPMNASRNYYYYYN